MTTHASFTPEYYKATCVNCLDSVYKTVNGADAGPWLTSSETITTRRGICNRIGHSVIPSTVKRFA